MAAIEEFSIALPTRMASLVRQAVDTGEYSSQSEVVCDALREWTYKRTLRSEGIQRLRDAWAEAIADDSEGLDPEPILDELEKKYQALADESERECA